MNNRWTACLPRARWMAPRRRILIGVLPGEGVGPEVIAAALEVLHGVAGATGLQVEIRQGGTVGRDAERVCGAALSPHVIQFCNEIFGCGGAILNGPGGGRYVYDLRKRFDLFFKISPLQSVNGVADAARLRPEACADVDILMTRENSGGAYQGTWAERGLGAQRVAEHHLSYNDFQIQRFLNASARLAQSRRGLLTVVWKEAGVPAISRLWREHAEQAAANAGIRLQVVDVDLMAYRLVQEAAAFDVVAAPNLFGDILADLGGVLLGSRGLTYSGNYTERGEAVYQTNHGAAYDLAGADRANPCAQILALAMMLRETFDLQTQARAIELAVRQVWREGWRTADVAAPGRRCVGTREMGRRVAEQAKNLLSQTVAKAA